MLHQITWMRTRDRPQLPSYPPPRRRHHPRHRWSNPCPAPTAPPPGHEFDSLPPHEQSAAAERLAVLSRVEPLHKLRLVELLRQRVGQGGLPVLIKEGAGWGVGVCGRERKLGWGWWSC